MEASETIESPQTVLIQEIHIQYWILADMAAKMEARKYTGGEISRLVKFREPLIKLVSLASFNLRFAEIINGFYPRYQQKMQKTRINNGNYLKLTNETLMIWRNVSRALRDSKIIQLKGE
ncbi:hypothetical protein [Methanosarcina sp. UBA289]|uniref:hypothetical protein n=1 Tax=Methanosarcina sp. UBA289 TaxID=1915574 RepID=UPI0025FB591E|nr:hypothetical protein [Methanosarcina sp. UBA289]